PPARTAKRVSESAGQRVSKTANQFPALQIPAALSRPGAGGARQPARAVAGQGAAGRAAAGFAAVRSGRAAQASRHWPAALRRADGAGAGLRVPHQILRLRLRVALDRGVSWVSLALAQAQSC